MLLAGCLPAAAFAQTSFQTHQITSSSSSLYEVAAHGDFNSDGRADLIVSLITAGQGSQGYILLSNGDGTYDPPRALPGNLAKGNAIAGDFNGDGKLDAVTQSGTNTVEVYLGNGDGTFQSPKSFTRWSTTPGSSLRI